MELIVKKHLNGNYAVCTPQSKVDEATGLILEGQGGFVEFAPERRPAEGTLIKVPDNYKVIDGWWKVVK